MGMWKSLRKLIKSRIFRLVIYLIVMGILINIGIAFIYLQKTYHFLNGEEESAAAYYRQIFQMNVYPEDEDIEPLHSYNESIEENSNSKPSENFFKINEAVNILPKCSLIPPRLRGTLNVETSVSLSFEELEDKYHHLNGGHYNPPNCSANVRVAIIVPYRNRKQHLKIFLNHMHYFLPLQQLDYRIFVVELTARLRFNRGLLMNVGFMEANLYFGYDCFIFHDVDLLPENDWIMYKCAKESPKHLSTAIDKFNYSLPYDTIFGGVTAIDEKQFFTLNGYSNKFFGWGGEDDDMFNRIKATGMTVTRYPEEYSRYKMLLHKQEKKNRKRKALLNSGLKRWRIDGINHLVYKALLRHTYKLYTYVLVDIDEDSPAFRVQTGDAEFYREFQKQKEIDTKRAAEGAPIEDLQSIFS